MHVDDKIPQLQVNWLSVCLLVDLSFSHVTQTSFFFPPKIVLKAVT